MNRLMEKKILGNINHIVSTLVELSYAPTADKEPFYHEAANLLWEIHPLLMRLIDGKKELLESLVRQLISQKLPHPSIQSSFGTLPEDLNTVIARYLALVEQRTEAETVEKTPSDDIPAQDIVSEEALPIEDSIDEPAVEEPLPAEESIDEPAAETEITDTIEETIEEAAAEIITATEQPPAAPPPVESAPSAEAMLPPPPEEKPVPDILQSIIAILYAKEKIIKGYLYRSLTFDYYLPERKIAIIAIKPLQRKHLFYETLLKKDGITLLEITPAEAGNRSVLYNKLQRYV